eukprot:g74160.t1
MAQRPARVFSELPDLRLYSNSLSNVSDESYEILLFQINRTEFSKGCCRPNNLEKAKWRGFSISTLADSHFFPRAEFQVPEVFSLHQRNWLGFEAKRGTSVIG